MMRQLHHGTIQVIVVAILVTCCAGVWNTLMSLGVGADDQWHFMNAAVMTMYFTFALSLLVTPAILNALGHKVLLCIGGLSYALFMVAPLISILTRENKEPAGDGIKSICIIAGLLLGIGSAAFWAAVNDLLVLYIDPKSHAVYVAPFVSTFYGGSVIAAIIAFLITITRSHQILLRYSVYYTFVGIAGVASLAVWLIIAPPEKVEKSDGSLAQPRQLDFDLKRDFRNLIRCFTSRTALILPLFFISQWFYPYHFNYNNSLIFDTPSRAINSAIYWIASIISLLLMDLIITRVKLIPKHRAAIMWAICLVLFGISWGLLIVIQFSSKNGLNALDKDRNSWNQMQNRINYGESSKATLPAISVAFGGLATGALQVFCVYLLVAIMAEKKSRNHSKDGSATVVAHATLYKIIQAIGAGIAWGCDIRTGIKYRGQLWIGLSAWFVAMTLAYVFVRRLEVGDFHTIDRDVRSLSLVLNNPVEMGVVSRGSRRENHFIDV